MAENKSKYYTETIWPVIENLEPVTLSGNQFRRFKARLMFSDQKNNNGRVYKRGLVEREIGKIQERINRNKVVGETDHPDDMVSRVRNTGVKWTKIWVEQDAGLIWVKGEGLIPHTSMGKELEACLEAGIAVGFSARGRGTLMPGNWKNEKVMIMGDDWQLYTFDAVIGESNEGADIEDTWTETGKAIKRKPKGLGPSEYTIERESTAGVCNISDGLLVCGECLTEVQKMEQVDFITEGREEDKQAQKDRAKKKHKVGEYRKEQENVEQVSLPKVSGLTFKIKTTDEDFWKNMIKNGYVTGVIMRGFSTAYYAEYDEEYGLWNRELHKFKVDEVVLSTDPNDNPSEIKITDEGSKTVQGEVLLGGDLAYNNYDGVMTPESLAVAMEQYISLGGIIYYDNKPIGKIESWEGKAQVTETKKGKEGDQTMEIKDLKIEDIQKDRPDLIESVRKTVESEIQTKLKDKAFLESVLKAAGIGLPEPPKIDVKIPEDVKALESKLSDLTKKVEDQGKVIQEQADKLKADADRKSADVKIEEELKSPAYEKTGADVKEIVKKRLTGKISKPEFVSEQVKIMVETVSDYSKSPEGKGKTNLPGSDGQPGPVTEQKKEGEPEVADETGLTPSAKAKLATIVPKR